MLLGLAVDAAIFSISLIFGPSMFVIGVFAWVLVPGFLVISRKRIAVATGIFLSMPVWPFVAYAVLMLSLGITF